MEQNRRQSFIEFALDHEDLTARELAFKYTDEEYCFISESSAYHILHEADLLMALAHVTISAADEFRDETTRPNELWQTDFTYFKIIHSRDHAMHNPTVQWVGVGIIFRRSLTITAAILSHGSSAP